MDANILKLIQQRDHAKWEYERLTREVTAAEQSCQHEWDYPEGKYNPIIRDGYRVPAFKAGSDSEPEHWVPREETPRWMRKCLKCGKIEETTQVNTRAVTTPKW